MKKSKFRSTVWIILTSISLMCYVYLHVVSAQEMGGNSTALCLVQQERGEELHKDAKVIFPGLVLIHKAMTIAKSILIKD